MLIGICTNMNTPGIYDVGLEQTGYCKSIGIEYVELSLDRLMRHSDAVFNALCSDLNDSGLSCLACNNFIPPEVRLVSGEYDKSIFEGYIVKALARAAKIGARKVVFGSAGARNVPSDFPMERAKEQILERLCFIADIAEKNGVEIEIEHLNRLESNIINTFEESVALAKRMNRPNVKSIFDYYHFALSGEREELITQNERWIGHMHFACTLGRHMPDIHDAKNLAPLLSILKSCAYDGTFSIEAYFPDRKMDDMSFAEVIASIKRQLN